LVEKEFMEGFKKGLSGPKPREQSRDEVDEIS
jgi:hypothetical protein